MTELISFFDSLMVERIKLRSLRPASPSQGLSLVEACSCRGPNDGSRRICVFFYEWTVADTEAN